MFIYQLVKETTNTTNENSKCLNKMFIYQLQIQHQKHRISNFIETTNTTKNG